MYVTFDIHIHIYTYVIAYNYMHTYIVIATSFIMEKWKSCISVKTGYINIHIMEYYSAIKKNEFAFCFKI